MNQNTRIISETVINPYTRIIAENDDKSIYPDDIGNLLVAIIDTINSYYKITRHIADIWAEYVGGITKAKWSSVDIIG